MMEMYRYGACAHHVAKLIANERFPLTRRELGEKYGDAPIEVDHGVAIPFSELLNRMSLDQYATAVAFYAALNAIL